MRGLQLWRSADEWWQEQVPRSRGCSWGRWQGTVAGDGSRRSSSISEPQRGMASSGAGGDVQTVPALLIHIDLPCCWEGNAASPCCFALLITWPLIFIAASLARALGGTGNTSDLRSGVRLPRDGQVGEPQDGLNVPVLQQKPGGEGGIGVSPSPPAPGQAPVLLL